jgi:hypothetical protein
MINISIVIYNQHHTEISSIIDKIAKSSCVGHIYIIDNSKIYNIEIASFKRIIYVFNNKNLGYGAGHNIAIKKTIKEGAAYHLVLNPDIIVEGDVSDRLLELMENNKDIGLIMPSIKYPDGQTQHLCKLLATPIDLIGRRFIPLRKWIEERNNKYELLFTGYNKTMQVPSLSGCFMLLRTDVLEKIGGFDERFFMYFEDFDLCRRIGQVSKTVYYPEVSVIHNYEKGSYKISKLLFYHIHSAFKYFNKWSWFFDKERRRINRETLGRLGYKNRTV